MQVRLAVGDLLVGDRAAARRCATCWLAEPTSAFESPDPVGTLALMAVLACELQIAEPAPAITEALKEFTGLLAGAIPLPVDLLLAQLATVTGSSTDAVDRIQRALALLVRCRHSARGALPGALAEAQLAAGDKPQPQPNRRRGGDRRARWRRARTTLVTTRRRTRHHREPAPTPTHRQLERPARTRG